MKRYLAIFIGCVLMLSVSLSARAAPTRFSHLAPGRKASLTEEVPVNFVFVGYDRAQVHESQFLRGLPATYRPIVRSRLFYDIVDYLGITYTYDYETHYADSDYEDRFFSRLSSLAEPAPLTEFQRAYNDQKSNVLTVKNNHHIDAPSVEQWLAEHPPAGVDTTQDTIFFINWYERDDFEHHVYTKTDEPDPDTGHNFGVENESRKIIAWGGTTADDEESGLGDTHRVWFYDLSAGPESWTDNWNVDDPDLPNIDDNSKPDYRMPPIWEYTANGFRRPSALTGDLSKVARYVGIDLLFTTSPAFPPDLTPPALPERIDLDATTYEGWSGVNASERYVTESLLLQELRELQPLNEFSTDNEDAAFDGRARTCYVMWLANKRCFPRRPYPAFANLFVYNALRVDERRDDGDRVDYEAGLLRYSVEGKKLEPPLLGFADDNWRDGTQSLIFSFVSPGIVELGYGLTTTDIHEYGHHAAMSHPHDGFDYETRTDFGPADQFYFAWSGDENNSIMSYIDLNWDFSQFDRDNMARFLTAEYVTNANLIAAKVLADPDADEATGELERADEAIGRAQQALARHDYAGASRRANTAYELVREAAEEVGVVVEGDDSGTEVDPPLHAVRPGLRSALVDPLGKHGHRAFQP